MKSSDQESLIYDLYAFISKNGKNFEAYILK